MPNASQILADRWQLLDLIGEGAMGEVWRGRHTVLGHDVAIKLMKPESSSDRELVARFRREARIAAHLRHRNLVRVEDFGTTSDGRPFLVMEYLRGQSLAAVLRQTPRLEPALVARIVHNIAAACDVAHAAGIVHRDLKPDNCFVVTDEDGATLVKVLDFGVAKVLDGMFVTSSGVLTASNALLGTPMYMSPEQARGQRDLDGRSDLWSLGVIAFEMLTGQLPYSAPTLSQLLFSVLTGPIPVPSSIERSIAPSVDAWMARALHRDRAFRFQSGREMSGALAAALGVQLPIASVPPPPMSVESNAPSVSGVGPTTPLAVVSMAQPGAPTPGTPASPLGPGSTLALPLPGAVSRDGKTVSDRPPRPSSSTAPPSSSGALPPTQAVPVAYPTHFPAPAPLPHVQYPVVAVSRTEPAVGASYYAPYVSPPAAVPANSNRFVLVLFGAGVCAGVFLTAAVLHSTARARARATHSNSLVNTAPIPPPPYYPPLGGFVDVTMPTTPAPTEPASAPAAPHAHGPATPAVPHAHAPATIVHGTAPNSADGATRPPTAPVQPLPSSGSNEYDPATP